MFDLDRQRRVERLRVTPAGADGRKRFGQAQCPIEPGTAECALALGAPFREVTEGAVGVALEDSLAATDGTGLVARFCVENDLVGKRPGEDRADHALALAPEDVAVLRMVDESPEKWLEMVIELRAVAHADGLAQLRERQWLLSDVDVSVTVLPECEQDGEPRFVPQNRERFVRCLLREGIGVHRLSLLL